MADLPAFHGRNDLIGVGEHSAPRKAGGDRFAAVHARDDGILRVTAQFQRFLDDRGEVPVLPDVRHPGIGDHRGGKDPVGVAGAQRHDTVCGEEDGGGDVLKLRLLVLPGGAEISLEVRIALFQLRITVGGQEFRVGINVDALALGLGQKLLGVVKVVAGNDDERPFLDGQRDFCRFRFAKGTGVGMIQQFHGAEAGFSGPLHQEPKLLHG